MKIQTTNPLKKHLCMAFAIMLISCFTSCKKDSSLNTNGYIVKAKISNADLLFNTQKVSSQQGYSTDFNEVLLKQNKSGKIEPVYFLKENGDSITMNIFKFRKLSDKYLLLSGDFQLKDGSFSSVLVNTKTENIYAFPNDYSEYSWLWESVKIENDKNGNLYFGNSDMIYKINVSSPNNIIIEEYLPQNQQPSRGHFMINPDGVCFYRSGGSNANSKFKLPSGSIIPFNHLFGDYTQDGSGLFGFDGNYYGNIGKSGEGYKLYRIDFDTNEPKTTIILSDRGQLYLYKNHIKKTYFAFLTESNFAPYPSINTTYSIIEIDGTPGKEIKYPLENSVDISGLTANYAIAIQENRLVKMSLSDYSISYIELGSKSDYEISSDMQFDINSDIISFIGLRYRDGKNIIGTVDANNNVSIEVVEQGKPINLVKLN